MVNKTSGEPILDEFGLYIYTLPEEPAILSREEYAIIEAYAVEYTPESITLQLFFYDADTISVDQ